MSGGEEGFSVWPFIRELFFSRKAILLFILRNKIAVLLSLANLGLFLMVLFISEQAIRIESKYVDAKQVLSSSNVASYKDRLDHCEADLESAQDNYRMLSEHGEPGQKPSPTPSPTPAPVPASQDPVIVNRDGHEGEDLRRTLLEMNKG